MSDKLKQSISVVPEFVEGETPSPAKLNAIGAQLELAASQLELAIGDIRGDSWPYTAASTTKLTQPWGRARTANTALAGAVERSLDITNVGRLIGPASNLNPRMLGPTSVTEPIPVGVHEFALRYPVSGTIDATNPNVSADPSLTIFVSTKTALDTAGQYTVDSDGRVYCVTATSGGNVTYTTDPTAYAGGLNPQGASFNVIPDPNQLASGADITITGPVSGVYTLTLPTVTQQQSDINGSSTILDSEDLNYLAQLEVPDILQSSLLAGDEIPSGFLFLKNYTTGEAYVDGIYKYNNATTVTVENVDLATAIAAGHKFVIITIGSDITTAIDDLRQKSFHTHDRSFGEPFVQLEGVTGFISEAGASGPFVPSENASNFAPQYLHRDGWRTGVDDNLNDENAMRGNIVMGYAAGSAGSYTTGSGETFGVIFGDPTYVVPSTIQMNSTNKLALTSNSGIELISAGDEVTIKGFATSTELILGSLCYGIRGDAGDNSNAVKFYRHNGFINMNGTGALALPSITDIVPKNIVSFTMTIEDTVNNVRFKDGQGAANYGLGAFSVWYDYTTSQFNVYRASTWGASYTAAPYELFIVYRD